MSKNIGKESFKRIKLLGDGSFGKAYLCEDLRDGSKAVVKEIEMKSMSEKEKVDTLREAKILQALHHPNIIRFKEVYTTKSGKLKIAMDYAEGGDLAKKIKECKGPIPEKQVLDWFTQICLGMKHIHDRKIIHRDIKSQNIFLTKDEIVKIGDFGIAAVLSFTRQKVKTVIGTPYYLSPEIIENKPYSFQTDIWSIGVILYELLCRKPPFDGNSIQFLALKIVKGNYSPIPANYSKEMSSMVAKLLNINYASRPSVNEILSNGWNKLEDKLITNRIKDFLSESTVKQEFAHTIIHNKRIIENNFSLDSIPMVDEKFLIDRPPKSFLKKEESKVVPNFPARKVETPKSDGRINNLAKPKPVVKSKVTTEKSNGPKQRIVSNFNSNAVKKPDPSGIKRPVPCKPKPVEKPKAIPVNKEEENNKKKLKREEERKKMREDIKKKQAEGKQGAKFKIEWYPGWAQGENINPSGVKIQSRPNSRKSSKVSNMYKEESKNSSRLSKNSSRSKIREETPKKGSQKAAFERKYSSEQKSPSSHRQESSQDRQARLERIRKSNERILSRSNSARKTKEKASQKEMIRQHSHDRIKGENPKSKWLMKGREPKVQNSIELPPMPVQKKSVSNKSGMKNISSVEDTPKEIKSADFPVKSENVQRNEDVKNIELSKMFTEMMDLVNNACQKVGNVFQTQNNENQHSNIEDIFEHEELDISYDDLVSDPLYNKVEEVRKDIFKADDEALMYISGDSKLEVSRI